MGFILVTIGLLAQAYAEATPGDHGALHTFGVIDVVLGIVVLVFAAISSLIQAFD